MAKNGNISLSANKDNGDTPADDVHISFGNGEEGGFADKCEADECAADEDFVGEGVEHTAEFAGDVEFSGDGAVDNIGKAGDNEDGEGGVESEDSIVGPGDIEKHTEKEYGQDEPAKGQYVRNLF